MKTKQLATQPHANICINKSRLKVYNKETTPTYYLEDQQEFSIELTNPTQNVILAKIIINGKSITQGGLVLRQGEHIFLERYIDVAKKFKFETYTVSNSEEVKQAIQNNGDIRVEFYDEHIPITYPNITINTPYNQNPWHVGSGGWGGNGLSTIRTNTAQPTHFTTTGSIGNATYTSGSLMGVNNVNYNQTLSSNVSDAGTINCSNTMAGDFNIPVRDIEKPKLRKSAALFSKKIETGKVEMGSDSDQTFKTIYKQFNSWAFHTVEYKLLPISQKVNTTDDIKIRQYCQSCGQKLKAEFKRCPYC